MFSFEELIEAQLGVRRMIIESGVPEEVANRMFIKNITYGVTIAERVLSSSEEGEVDGKRD
jgi:hypothetical protein